MKMKVTLVVVLSATLCMAQKLTQTKPAPPDTASASVPQDAKKADCPCCQNMSNGNGAKSCCQHDAANTSKKETVSCCQGKDGVSCLKDDKGSSTDSTRAESKCCGGDGIEGCCAKPEKTSEHAAMGCCEQPDRHCEMMHRSDSDMSK